MTQGGGEDKENSPTVFPFWFLDLGTMLNLSPMVEGMVLQVMELDELSDGWD